MRLYTGNSFDPVGERKRTSYSTDSNRHTTDETFTIRVSNHKKDPTPARVVEHLNREENWDITQKNDNYKDIDSHTTEFPVDLAPDQTTTVAYTVHYSW